MNKCAWIGTGQGCNNHTVGNKSYCEEHVWLVYQQGSALRKRHKDILTSTEVQVWESLMNEAYEDLLAEGEI